MAKHITVKVEDVGGSLRRLVAMGPGRFRTVIKPTIAVSAHAVAARMRSLAPVGPDGVGRAPDKHIRDGIEVAIHPTKLYADVGFFSDADQAAVALYNEYTPNRQPFMRPAMEAEENDFHNKFVKALKAAAESLSQ